MIRRENFQMHGPRRNFGQRQILHGNYENAARFYNNVQKNDRESWLLQLGLSRFCARELTLESQERDDFNLQEIHQRWLRVCHLMGTHRQMEANSIILRELRELLLNPNVEQECPPPPPVINWNEHTKNSVVEPGNRYLLIGNTSTPMGERRSGLKTRESLNNADKDCTPVDVDNKNKDLGDLKDASANRENNDNNNNQHKGDRINPVAPNLEENYIRNQRTKYLSNNIGQYTYRPFPDNVSPHLKLYHYINESRYNNNNFHRHNPYFKHQQYNRKDQQLPTSNFGENYGWHETRKRKANTVNEPEDQTVLKKRNGNQVAQKLWFKISDYQMPYVRDRNDPLPQPEYESYAVKFYARKHSFIIGGEDATLKRVQNILDIKSSPGFIGVPRGVGKRIRLNLRMSWSIIYNQRNYKNWDLWWQDYKYCEQAIDDELKQYEGINLKESLLQFKIDYNVAGSIDALLFLAEKNFASNINNFQSILCTIFELKNTDILEKLSIGEMKKLQNLIRYESNESWTYKMKGMVYLWDRYSEIQAAGASGDVKQLMTTKTQWLSPLFHWLAQQAYAELKIISAIEWKDHKERY